jgi:hypothetical protein
VAEWQTRWLQVPVLARVWEFDSPFGHKDKEKASQKDTEQNQRIQRG